MIDKKTPLHMHEHPAYGWVALMVSVAVILGVAGWYYLTYTQGLNDDFVQSVKDLAAPKREVSISSATTASGRVVTDIKAETSTIDKDLNLVSDSDLSDTQLDNTILGIQ